MAKICNVCKKPIKSDQDYLLFTNQYPVSEIFRIHEECYRKEMETNMAKCPKCGSTMTFWMTVIHGSHQGKQKRLCRNEKGKRCRYVEHRTAPKRVRNKIKRRWRKVIEE